MDLERKLYIASRGAEEIITESELRDLLETGGGKGYIGVEPSGLFHIGWLIWAFKFKDLIDVGFKMNLLLATWHAWINDKLGGDIELIRRAGDHIVDVLEAIGIDRSSYRRVLAEDLVRDMEYWETLIRSAKEVSLARVRRALTIMGRKADESESDFSKLIYPLMQVTDIFYMDLDIALGGTDQRKAHMLARDIAEKTGRKKIVAVHTPLLPSLQGAGRMELGKGEIDEIYAEIKMSKSKPETAVFVYDDPGEIRAKILKAYCPPREVEGNPVLMIARDIIFRVRDTLEIKRKPEYGGDVVFESYGELEKSYREGKLHPLDLKNAVVEELISILEPVRRYFSTNKGARETLEAIKRARITR